MAVVQKELRQAIPSVFEALEFCNEGMGRDLAVDTETTGLLIRDGRDHTQGISVAYRNANGRLVAFYFPFWHRFGENYGAEVWQALCDLVESASSYTFHNAKFDIVALRTRGIVIRSGSWICTMMMAHLINENFPFSKKLEDCAKAYLPEGVTKEMPEEMAAIVNAKGLGWAYVPSELMWDYARQDAVVTYMLREKLWPMFKAENLQDYWPHKARLIEVVIEMEKRGIGINVPFVKSMIDAAEQAVQDYSDVLGGDPGKRDFLIQKLLVELKLPVVKRSAKTGEPSFDKEAMAVYDQILEAHGEELAQHIKAYRGWVHARGLFYRPYLELISPDGKIRPNYKHHKDESEGGTVTGRLSCADPNLQQIPRVTDKPWNGRVKQSFVASPGYTLWEADYSQLELRLGVAYANEPTLKQVFLEDRDIFTEMSQVLGWPRHNTKTFVYSVQYGAGKTRIAVVFAVSEAQAQELINQYYRTYPNFRIVSDKAKAKVLATRKIKLWSGRYRHFRFPKDENHKAFNSLIQGGAADIVERVMVRLFDEVDQKSNGEVRMLLQVHDSVVFEIKNGTEEKWGPIIKDLMSDVNSICADFGVKFAVDFHQFGLAA